jgi:nitrogen fixation/metabolism regulation signal transduction histidine kinase
MPAQTITPQRLADLRLRATSRLTGATGPTGVPESASGALAVLHQLASSPSTAPDALALLHELQVYQVEMDLQAEALSESRAELETALRRQIDLYDALPVGCFTIDAGLVVHALNMTAAGMLGIAREEAHGLALDGFLAAESQRAVRRAVSAIAEGQVPSSPTLQLIPGAGKPRRVRARIGADNAERRFLLVLADTAGEVDDIGR